MYNFIKRTVRRFFFSCKNTVNKFIKILSKKEKLYLLLLIVVVLISLTMIIKNNQKTTILAADYGGILREGILSDQTSEITETVAYLTKIGLVRFDSQGNIIPALSKSWEISSDGKNYTFTLEDFVNSNDLLIILKKDPKWSSSGVIITAPTKDTLVFNLTQPFGLLLNNLTENIFPYGPYTVQKESTKEIDFVSNNNFFLGKPYIPKIKLIYYKDSASLIKAAGNNQLNSIASIKNSDSLPKKWKDYQMLLPRYVDLFFNLKREAIQSKDLRTKLSKGEKLETTVDLTLVTSDKPDYIQKAEEIKNKWQDLGVNLQISIKGIDELQQDIIPTRNYDLLLYGIDFGKDPDPYPFWHSSQISSTGLNLSNFSDVKADKLLEDTRLTNDINLRNQKYQDFLKILDEEVPVILLDQVTWRYATSDKIQGLINHTSFTGSDRFFEVWKWYIKTKKSK